MSSSAMSSSEEEEEETQFGVQRWVEPYSTDEIWSNVLDPVGAAFGCRQTCVDYTFFKILKTLWEVGLSVRLVMLHFDPHEELPQSQITYLKMQEFLNVEVKITLVKETFVEGKAFDGGIYRWDKNSFKLLKAPPVHSTFVNYVLGGDTPGVFHSDFTITVNHDCFFDEKKVIVCFLSKDFPTVFLLLYRSLSTIVTTHRQFIVVGHDLSWAHRC